MWENCHDAEEYERMRKEYGDKITEMMKRTMNRIIEDSPKETNTDPVNHPSHYTQARTECIDILEDLNLPFHVATAFVYIWRSKFKGKEIEDLKKAVWYLERYIKLNEGKKNG